MNIINISSIKHPGIEMFSSLTEAQLRNRANPEDGIFIAESPKVINVALNAGYKPLALLCERKHITGDAADIIKRCGDIPVFYRREGCPGWTDRLHAYAGRPLRHAQTTGKKR